MRVSLLTGIVLLCSAALVVPCPTLAADEVDAAFALRLAGQTDQALEQLQKLVAERPQLGKGWYELARAQFYLLQLDDAQQSIDKAIALEPDNARFHYLAGTVAGYRAVLSAHKKGHESELGDDVGRLMQRWLQELQKTVELQPENYRACIDLVNAYRQTPAEFGGDPAKAEPLIQRLESASPVDGAEARAMTIDAARQDELLALWQRTVDAHGDSAAAHAGLALAALRAGDLDEAALEIDRAVQLDPQRVRLQLDLARTAAMRGQHERAMAAAQRYLKADPAPPAALRAYATFYLAAIERRQQHADQAETLLQQARTIDPHVWTTLVPPPAVLFEQP
jgi:tetratricopeptide (TPR) repeat protein